MVITLPLDAARNEAGKIEKFHRRRKQIIVDAARDEAGKIE
jgi:hypothetical protein